MVAERAVERAEFAGDFGICGEEGGGFDHAGTGHACVEGGAAADDADAVDLLEGGWGETELVEVSGGVVVVETAVEGAGDGEGLLVDFLEHEVREGAAGGGVRGEVEIGDVP